MIYNFWCLDCHAEFSKETPESDLRPYHKDGFDFDGIPCPYCEGAAKMMGRQATAIVTGKCFTPVAVMEDKDGRQYEINNKGKPIPESSRKYKNDPRGWKRKGKKNIRQFDQYGKLNNR